MPSLFYNCKIVIESLKFQYSLLASEEFISCADKQLTEIFKNQTGINPGKNACISLTEHFIGAPIYTTYLLKNNENILAGRKLMINLYINHHWNPITILWKSQSGIDYKLHDIIVDCNDIEFWFEHLDVSLYLKQFSPNNTEKQLQLKNLSFTLDIVTLNTDCSMLMTVKDGTQKEILINQLVDFIEKFNTNSEKKNRIYGIVHNSKATIENTSTINFDIDLGSAGLPFLKKILKKISGLNSVEKIEIS
jgi:hypothetical protein